MKLTVLIDNFVPINKYFLGEPGLSFLIEDGETQILFDTGYSDALIRNAEKMNLNLLQTDFIVISHGHNDHTGGLIPLMKLYSDAAISNREYGKPTLIAHSKAFDSKSIGGVGQIGSPVSIHILKDAFKLELANGPIWLTERMVFLGEIKRSNDFENQNPLGKIQGRITSEDDYLLDDTALAYKSPDGLVIVTGCSHSGLCNIIEHAMAVCGEKKIRAVIGGFHLLNPPDAFLSSILKYLQSQKIHTLYPCHCVDHNAKTALSTVGTVGEMGVGISLNFM